MRPASSFPRLLITAALAAVFAFSVPVFVDRREYTVAVSNLVKKPTLENVLAVEKERVKYRRIALVTHLATGGVLFAVISLIWSFFARQRAKSDESLT